MFPRGILIGSHSHPLLVALSNRSQWNSSRRPYTISGVPNNIITDNGTQFTMREFKDFCVDLSSKVNHASFSHLQSNSQVEHSNGMIIQGLKPIIFYRLKPYVGKWVKELPSVLWVLCTTSSHVTSHTPFSLVYGLEAMLPTKVEHKSF
jgi:hypothetical protein